MKPAAAADLSEQLQIQLGKDGRRFPMPLADILVQRGVQDLKAARRFLQPGIQDLWDPFLMKDMETTCARILAALESAERVLIYGDYDVDGTTSVSLLQLFFSDLGFEFEVYIPNRFTEGYGISFEGVQHAVSTGCGLMIALDCGTKAIEKIRFAVEQGVDVIVVDHHQPGDVFPPTVAMLNPLQPGCEYPDKGLSACALTMKLCQALVQRLPAEVLEKAGPNYDPFLRYCDLVGLSIACDIVPLRAENRAMLHFGIEKIRKNPSPGLAALMALDQSGKEWSVSDLVFYIGPRINSAGRLQLATESVALLTGRSSDLNILAASLDTFNEERKILDKEITQQALEMILEENLSAVPMSTVLYGPLWNKGVIGIVASRLIEQYHRPTILLTKSGDYLVGSGRSVPGFDLHDAIEACSEHLIQFGGHKYAAGLTLKEEQFLPFKAAFEAYVEKHITEASKIAEIQIDAPLKFADIDDRFIRLLRRMAPFGPSNPEPNFVSKRVKVKECNILKGEHVKLLLEQDGVVLEGIAFFRAAQWNLVNALELDLVFQPDVKTWNGRTYVQLKVKDFRAAV
jgi:single-stranded-DNA-specific exonuclease